MEQKEEKLSRAISALARRKILKLLADKELTVKEISAQVKQSVSLTSRHLKLLYDLGFLHLKKEFPFKYYSLKIKEVKELLVKYDKVINKL